MTLPQLTEFFGWASVINIGILLLAFALLLLMKDSLLKIHGRLLDIPEQELRVIYVKYLAYYKILVFVFMLAPYLSLKLMGS